MKLNSTFIMVLITSFSIIVFIYLFIYLHIFNYCDLKFTSSVRYSLKMFGSKLLLLLLLLFYVSSIFYSKHLCFKKIKIKYGSLKNVNFFPEVDFSLCKKNFKI